jgi:hypothetical protein
LENGRHMILLKIIGKPEIRKINKLNYLDEGIEND